jgi:multidrug resistance protein
MVAPAVSQVVTEFDIDNDFLASLVVSAYVLGLAFGPLLLAPFSEVYGRWICYTISNIFYVVFTIASAVSSNFSMLIVFRFLAGAMGAAPLTIGGGTIADLFPVHQRGVVLSFYLLGPTSGPAIGPVAGGFLAQEKGWRWIFWSLAIVVRFPCIFDVGYRSGEHADGIGIEWSHHCITDSLLE